MRAQNFQGYLHRVASLGAIHFWWEGDRGGVLMRKHPLPGDCITLCAAQERHGKGFYPYTICTERALCCRRMVVFSAVAVCVPKP